MVFNSLSKKINLILNKLAAILPEGVRGKSFIERGTTPLELRFVGYAKIFEEHEKMQLIHNYQPELTNQTINEKNVRSCKGAATLLIKCNILICTHGYQEIF